MKKKHVIIPILTGVLSIAALLGVGVILILTGRIEIIHNPSETQEMRTVFSEAERHNKIGEIPADYWGKVPMVIDGMDFEYIDKSTLEGMEIVTVGFNIPDTGLYLQFKSLVNTSADYIKSSITANGEPITKAIADVGMEIHPYTDDNVTIYTATFRVDGVQYTVTSNMPQEDIERVITDFLTK